ncbi:MAG: CHASE2 domain-containing protein [Bryobacteraceae bacterium]
MRLTKRHGQYVGLLALMWIVASLVSLSPLGTLIDNDVYDWFFRLHRPPDVEPRSALVVIDEDTLQATGGQPGLRRTICDALNAVSGASPKAVAIDVILADTLYDPGDDQCLEAAIRQARNVVLATDLKPDGGSWEEPLERFRRHAAGVGHVYAEPDPVSREILLHKIAGRTRHWALALEAYRAGIGQPILETPEDVQVGGITIPAPHARDRAMRINYVRPGKPLPKISALQLKKDPSLASRLAGKTVFIGSTAQSLARDRLQTPLSATPMYGVEIHANIFETIAHGRFLVAVPSWLTLALALAVAGLAGVTFALLSGKTAYACAAVLLAAAHLAPYFCFGQLRVLPLTPLALTAWLAVSAAATYQHFVVRRRMIRAEGDKLRYQQAMHFVTHEMRTPLTAIQGSSELIGRYPLTEEKRKQVASVINSESKRLGKMIEVFLNVERLSAGQLELKKEPVDGHALMAACVERVSVLAERKQIRIVMEPELSAPLTGDRELIEYAFYNLLTNAVKYSPPKTTVTVFSQRDGSTVRVSVQDQGIGMDQKEVRQIFRKFYRTKKAEESGEAGTGIGLSIVEQIVTQHAGTIAVASSPGKGSCFTLVFPARVAAYVAE